ncbi:hypothetical protein [Paenibacillus sp. 1A_MP2]|uniref:hypothetical protein n=1 Tax=Paenibacillus sp. 1A_MP2 TaxID=3457495 RepID=UPI003FCDE452
MSGVNKGRIFASVLFILFGLFCFYTFKAAFSVAFLLLGIASIGIGAFNMYRIFAGKRRKRDPVAANLQMILICKS